MSVTDLLEKLPQSATGIFAGILIAGILFRYGTKWLDDRSDRIKLELKADFATQLAELTARVKVLEESHAQALGHIVNAIGLAGGLGEKGTTIREELGKAAESLR